jgi:hypothetical protein
MLASLETYEQRRAAGMCVGCGGELTFNGDPLRCVRCAKAISDRFIELRQQRALDARSRFELSI